MQLRKCPFCGRKAIMDSRKIENQIRYFVHCSNRDCSVEPCTSMGLSKVEVAEWWNGDKAMDELAKLGYCAKGG